MTQGQGDGGGDAAAEDGVAAAHDALLADERYQFEPTAYAPPPPPAYEPRAPRSDPGWLADLFAALGAVMRVVFWVGLAVLGALLAWYVVQLGRQAWSARGGRRVGAEAPAPYVPAAATARTLLDDAARLAARGRYGEAVRLILRRSIEDMERQRPGAVRDAMTAREIGRLAILTDTAGAAFGRIAALVERAAFAGRELTAREYEEARETYERLTRDAGGAPA